MVFSIELTDQMNLLRIKLADGRTTGWVKIYGPGYPHTWKTISRNFW